MVTHDPEKAITEERTYLTGPFLKLLSIFLEWSLLAITPLDEF
jgi:hypothetical protein